MNGKILRSGLVRDGLYNKIINYRGIIGKNILDMYCGTILENSGGG